MEKKIIEKAVEESLILKRDFFKKNLEKLIKFSNDISNRLKSGGKIFTFGNGGSAADAQHFAAEFVNRFLVDREPLPVIALTTDSSVLTSIANDYSFSDIFRKQIRAFGKENDIAIGISTSGRSKNVLYGLLEAKSLSMLTCALLGGDGGEIKDVVDISFIVPSFSTPRVQEVHIMILHLLCELVERDIFYDRFKKS